MAMLREPLITTGDAVEMREVGSNTGTSRIGVLKYGFQDVNVTVRVGGKDKTVVSKVTGAFESGELLAIMGPSGAGKSSLLDTLAGRKTVGNIGGRFVINGGDVRAKQVRRVSAYVSQEDTLLPTLTVRETFQYVADLQMTSPRQDREAQVDEMIRTLGLAECAEVRIGGGASLIRGVSGGQRRRVSIGMELLTQVGSAAHGASCAHQRSLVACFTLPCHHTSFLLPSSIAALLPPATGTHTDSAQPGMLFLDEPTSGLDSAAAMSLFRSLKVLTVEKHLLVMATIHQVSHPP
jgi:ABC-type multidrug transport system ATPase subunit